MRIERDQRGDYVLDAPALAKKLSIPPEGRVRKTKGPLLALPTRGECPHGIGQQPSAAYSGVRLIRRTNQPLPCPAAGPDFALDAVAVRHLCFRRQVEPVSRCGDGLAGPAPIS